MHTPARRQPGTTTAATRSAGVVLVAALLLAACNGAENAEEPENPSPTPPTTQSHEPTLDEDTAADLYVAWRDRVYALPPTQPEAVDIKTARDGIVVADSPASDWIIQELQLARDRGVIVRGTIHAEAIPPIQVVGDRASVTICSSADIRPTDLLTGEAVSDDTVDTSYTRFDASYRRIRDNWTVEAADRSDERNCVPPSIEEAVTARWEVFTEAWYERDRRGGGDELGRLEDVVTDRFVDILRQLPFRDPVPDPPPFTGFEMLAATRSTATGQACRSGGLETIEWMLVEAQWRVDFVGQVGQRAVPCP